MKIRGGGGLNPYIPLHESKMCTFADYLQGRAIQPHTSSAVFRNIIFQDGFLPDKMKNFTISSFELSMMGDSFRNIIHLHEGKLHYESEFDSVYLLTDSGVWQSMDNFNQMLYNCIFYKDMWLYYDKKYPELLYQSFILYRHLIMKENLEGIFLNDEKKLLFNIKVLQELYMLFVQNEETLHPIKMQAYCDLKTKYKFFLRLYKKLRAKFVRKNITWMCGEKSLY